MIRKTLGLTAMAALGYGVFCFAYSKTQRQSSNSIVLYEGARLIPGDGRQPIESAAMLVENGIITRIGSRGSVNAPRAASRVNLTATTVMRTRVNAHGPPGSQRRTPQM